MVRYIYCLTRSDSFKKDFGLRDQIQRAAVSIMANIAEGFGTKSDNEFIKYLSISVRSGYEVNSHLYVAKDIEYIDANQFNEAEVMLSDCIRLSKDLIKYLNLKPKP